MAVINTNIASINAQNNLSKSQNNLQTSLQRLSSGLRINSAKDDAAGLAISNRMTSQVRGLDQAVRNANDGISMIQTAEGALAESTNILQRMRELSVQSANGTYSEGNRTTLNAEVKQLKSELDRIASSTSFNGLNILDGTLGKTSLQVGSESNQTIDVEIGKMDTKALGLGAGADIVGAVTTSGTLQAALVTLDGDDVAGNDMKVNGVSVGDLTGFDATNSLNDVLSAMNSAVSTVTFDAVTSFTSSGVGDGIFSGDEGLLIQVASKDVATGDVGTNVTAIRIQDTSSMSQLVEKINQQGAGLVNASITDDGKLSINSTESAQMIVTASSDVTAAAPAAAATLGVSALGMTTAQAGAVTQKAQLSITSNTNDGIKVTYSDVTDADVVGVDVRHEVGTITGRAAPVAGTANINAGDVTINGVTLGEYDFNKDYDGNGTAAEESDLISWLNTYSAETGVTASLDDTDASGTTYVLRLASKDGSEISVQYKNDTVAGLMETKLGIQENNAVSGFGANVASVDISTAAGAQKAIDIIDGALDQVNSLRGDLGAVNNRLEFTMNNLSSISQNVSAARSRIEDADFAVESANLSRSQVLQQAGTAMLAQANAQPQQVLSLLQ
jgi:flagellin